MKKFIYIIAISIASSFALSACADEDIKPVQKPHNGGGTGSFDPL